MLLTWLTTAQVSGPESDPGWPEVHRGDRVERHDARETWSHPTVNLQARSLELDFSEPFFHFFLPKGLPSKSWVILCFLWGGIRLNIPRPAEKVFASLARRRSFESSFAIHSKPTFTRVCDFLNCCHEFCSTIWCSLFKWSHKFTGRMMSKIIEWEHHANLWASVNTFTDLSSFKPPFPTCMHSGGQRHLIIFCVSLEVFGLTSPLLPSIGSLASWQVRGPNLEWACRLSSLGDV